MNRKLLLLKKAEEIQKNKIIDTLFENKFQPLSGNKKEILENCKIDELSFRNKNTSKEIILNKAFSKNLLLCINFNISLLSQLKLK